MKAKESWYFQKLLNIGAKQSEV